MQGILVQGDSVELDSLEELNLLLLFTVSRFRRDCNSVWVVALCFGRR